MQNKTISFQILLFAYLKDKLGRSSLEINLPEGSTLQDLFNHLEGEYPQFQALFLASRLAVNQTYAQDLNLVLHPGDEIALIPPVSGG